MATLASISTTPIETSETDKVWPRMRIEAATAAAAEPVLASFLNATVLRHETFSGALSYRLAEKLADEQMAAMLWRDVAIEAYTDEPALTEDALADACATFDRDPACRTYVQPFLYFKGYHSLQSYRIANWLWRQDRKSLALYLQSRISELWGVDIHPAAQMGRGIFIDHAHGIVIGETARVGNNVSMLHDVTLGGTGKEHDIRHPKIGDGVLISTGAKVLGNIEVGDGAKIAAGSVVLESVPAHCTYAGVPAKAVGKCAGSPATEMDQKI